MKRWKTTAIGLFLAGIGANWLISQLYFRPDSMESVIIWFFLLLSGGKAGYEKGA